MRVENNTYQTKYFCVKFQQFISLENLIIKNSDLSMEGLLAHKENSRYIFQNPTNYKPVLRGIFPIPARSKWEFKSGGFKSVKQELINTLVEYDLKDLESASNKYVEKINRTIGIELSGGLDTSIVIGLLRKINADIHLIGAVSERFEFRTERHIQEILAKEVGAYTYIKDIESLPFTDLKECPPHVLPNKASLFYFINMPTLRVAKDKKISIILNGLGFDSLLIDQIGAGETGFYFNKSNITDPWPNDYVFHPNGVEYINVATIPFVMRMIISMRKNLKEDVQKLWARAYFQEYIPTELSRFQYKASFATLYHEGIIRARDEILSISKFAYEVSRLEELKPNEIDRLLLSILNFDSKGEFELLARLSYCLWIYKLFQTRRL